MLLEKLTLLNYKNYQEAQWAPGPGLNALTGLNGSGKTNLLDALYYLALTKSYQQTTDAQNVRHGQALFTIQAVYTHQQETFKVMAGWQSGKKKVLKVNGVPYERVSQHIGRFPVVYISPDDGELIKEGSEVRRRFFDSLLSQINASYLQNLLAYNRTLKQRNSLLKQTLPGHMPDADLLGLYDEQVVALAQQLHTVRQAFIKKFMPVFEKHYAFLSQEAEALSLHYESTVAAPNWPEQFAAARPKDLMLQRTTKGVHKDDYHLRINGHALKKYGSQGQQKSCIIALKLAQFDVLQQEKGFKPLLLLDDIFDKLDELRIAQLMEMVSGQAFGQIFLTDARPERTQTLLKQLGLPAHVFTVTNGLITPYTK